MVRTSRAYWVGCIRACVGVVIVTAGFSAFAAYLFDKSTQEDGQKIMRAWGFCAVVVPMLLFQYHKRHGEPDPLPASIATRILAVLVTGAFSAAVTLAAWSGLLAWRHLVQPATASLWPAEFRTSFLKSCAVEAGQRTCECLAGRLEQEGNMAETAAFLVRLEGGNQAATARMNELRAHCIAAHHPTPPPRRAGQQRSHP
jgi:hypothetical protein